MAAISRDNERFLYSTSFFLLFLFFFYFFFGGYSGREGITVTPWCTVANGLEAVKQIIGGTLPVEIKNQNIADLCQ